MTAGAEDIDDTSRKLVAGVARQMNAITLPGRDFDRDEESYRRGYQAALHPKRRGKAYAEVEDGLEGRLRGHCA